MRNLLIRAIPQNCYIFRNKLMRIAPFKGFAELINTKYTLFELRKTALQASFANKIIIEPQI